MTKVRPVLIPIRPGSKHQIECAVRSDGSQPAYEFYSDLRRKAWPDGVAQLMDPKLKPAKVFYVLLSRLKHFAATGRPLNDKTMNALQDGLWEFKTTSLRMAYFEVDMRGQLVKKGKCLDREIVDADHSDDYWEIPRFEQSIRLTHGFPKTGKKTRPPEIELAKCIRDEDLQND